MCRVLCDAVTGLGTAGFDSVAVLVLRSRFAVPESCFASKSSSDTATSFSSLLSMIFLFRLALLSERLPTQDDRNCHESLLNFYIYLLLNIWRICCRCTPTWWTRVEQSLEWVDMERELPLPQGSQEGLGMEQDHLPTKVSIEKSPPVMRKTLSHNYWKPLPTMIPKPSFSTL